MNLILNNTPTLCLNMIVKNEGKIITRLLESVTSIIDIVFVILVPLMTLLRVL